MRLRRGKAFFDSAARICRGMMRPEIYRMIYERACESADFDILELGAAGGAATVAAACGLVDSHKKSVLYTVEKGDGENSSRERLGNREQNLRTLNRNLKIFSCSEKVSVIDSRVAEASGKMPAGLKFSMLIIDADGLINRDFELFYNSCIPGADIIIDDYSEVKDFGSRSVNCPLGKKYTTFRLVNYFIGKGLIRRESLSGDTIFCRKPTEIAGPAQFDETEISSVMEDIKTEREESAGI